MARPAFRPVYGLFVILKKLFVLACVLVALFGLIGYAAGWVSINHQKDQGKVHIQIDTQRVEDDVENLIDKTRDALQQGPAVQEPMETPRGDAPDNAPDAEPGNERGTAPGNAPNKAPGAERDTAPGNAPGGKPADTPGTAPADKPTDR
jgi:hypothetical protein